MGFFLIPNALQNFYRSSKKSKFWLPNTFHLLQETVNNESFSTKPIPYNLDFNGPSSFIYTYCFGFSIITELMWSIYLWKFELTDSCNLPCVECYRNAWKAANWIIHLKIHLFNVIILDMPWKLSCYLVIKNRHGVFMMEAR